MDASKLGILIVNLNINFEEVSHLSTISANLIEAAIHVIQQHLSAQATLFRIGVFELAIMVENLQFSAQLNLIASKLANAFETELPLENITLILKPIFGGVSSLETHVSALSPVSYTHLDVYKRQLHNKVFTVIF